MAETGTGETGTERLLVLTRHGQSAYNARNLFTGWHDPDLTERGEEEAREAGRLLAARGLRFGTAVTTDLVRARRSCALMLDAMGLSGIEVLQRPALRERDYGDLAGLDKDDARARFGDAQVQAWRRSYDARPPGGESLRDTASRVLPCYIEDILPRVMEGRRVLVAAHGNSLRALVMVLDRLSPERVADLEIATGVPLAYRLGPDTRIVERRVVERENHGGHEAHGGGAP